MRFALWKLFVATAVVAAWSLFVARNLGGVTLFVLVTLPTFFGIIGLFKSGASGFILWLGFAVVIEILGLEVLVILESFLQAIQ